MKNLANKFRQRLIVALVLFSYTTAIAQCPNDNNFQFTLIQPPCATDASVGLGAGTYAEIPVFAGVDYTFQTCGSSFNTQLTGYQDSSTTSVFFNDDNGPECQGNQASVQWTATFTGTLRVLIDLANCDPCFTPDTTTGGVPTDCILLGSATLRYRQNNNLAITSIPDPLCSEELRVLTATPSGGAFSGAGVTDSLFEAPTTGGVFPVTYTIAQCDIIQNLVVNEIPTVTIVGDTALCPGSTVTLIADALPGSGAVISFQWKLGLFNIGVNNATITVSQPGSYTVVVTNSNDCVTESAPIVIVDHQGPTVRIVGRNSFCGNGDDVTLTAMASAGSGSIASYEWKFNGGANGRTDSFITTNQGGNYSVVVSNTNGCSTESAVFSVDQFQPPLALAFKEDITCNGLNNGTVSVSVIGGATPYSYSWNNTSTDSVLNGVMPGIYLATVADANGCIAVTNSITVIEPAALVLNLIELQNATCNQKNGLLTVEGDSGVLPYQYSISGGIIQSNGNFQNLVEETYVVNMQDAKGCQVSDTFNIINLSDQPSAEISTNKDIACVGDSIELSTLTGSDLYQWSNGENSSSIVVAASGKYIVTITNSGTCIDVDSISVTILDSMITEISNDTLISLGFSAPLWVTGGVFYDWMPVTGLDDPTSNTPIATPLDTITYTVFITDVNGCETSESVTIYVDADFTLIVPNLFTPNGDGFNETWIIENLLLYDNCEVVVFNRWGNEVFSSKQYNNDWDGTSNGKELSDGTYYYLINCEGADPIKAAVTILR